MRDAGNEIAKIVQSLSLSFKYCKVVQGLQWKKSSGICYLFPMDCLRMSFNRTQQKSPKKGSVF